jgi:hypothetical protein
MEEHFVQGWKRFGQQMAENCHARVGGSVNPG